MNTLRNWLKKLMYGRYGVDQLSMALIIFSIPFSLLLNLFKNPFVSILAYVPLILGYLRILSKNITRRRSENYTFLKYWYPIKTSITKKIERLKAMRTHHYYKCPHCLKTLRVPRGKGKIRITCPYCKHEFSKKS